MKQRSNRPAPKNGQLKMGRLRRGPHTQGRPMLGTLTFSMLSMLLLSTPELSTLSMLMHSALSMPNLGTLSTAKLSALSMLMLSALTLTFTWNLNPNGPNKWSLHRGSTAYVSRTGLPHTRMLNRCCCRTRAAGRPGRCKQGQRGGGGHGF